MEEEEEEEGEGRGKSYLCPFLEEEEEEETFLITFLKELPSCHIFPPPFFYYAPTE